MKCIKCSKEATTSRTVSVHYKGGALVLNEKLWTPEDVVKEVTFDLCDEHARRLDDAI